MINRMAQAFIEILRVNQLDFIETNIKIHQVVESTRLFIHFSYIYIYVSMFKINNPNCCMLLIVWLGSS